MSRSVVLSLLLVTAALPAHAQYALRASHAGAGHGTLANGSYALRGSIGQAADGTAESASWRLRAGFWSVLSRADDSGAVFAVSIDGTNSPVTEGETLTVTNTVENTGDAAGTQSVRLSVGGVERASQSVTLDPGQTSSPTLSWATASGDGGDYTATVATDDQSASTSISVVVPVADCALAWSLEIGGTDEDIGDQTLTLGQSADATGGLDTGCGEAELPPVPVNGFMDLRFVGTNLPGVDLGLGSRTDIRPSDVATGTGDSDPPIPGEAAPAIWKIGLTSDAYPITLAWDHTALASAIPDQPVLLVDAATGGNEVAVDMKQSETAVITNAGVSSLLLLLDQSLTRTLNLRDGWNLASIPLTAPDMTFGTLLGTECQNGFLYTPGSGYVSLAATDELTPGQGGFFNCTAGSLDLAGRPPSPPNVDIASGWNIVGPAGTNIAPDAVQSRPEGIVQSSFYALDPSAGYVPATELHATRGYWVKVSTDGILSFGRAKKAPEKATTRGIAGRSTQLPDGLQLEIVDAQNRQTTLHFVEGLSDATLDRYALPPRPPSDIFDVRFSEGAWVASVPEENRNGKPSLHDVRLQSVRFPLQLRMRGRLDGRSLQIDGENGLAIQLTSKQPSADIARPTSTFQIAVLGKPTTTALYKNSPNPAAGHTTIRYSLSASSDVRLDLYDVLGRRVMRLVDESKPAGAHRTSLDTSTLPTGTYFYRLQTEEVVRARRMTVVR